MACLWPSAARLVATAETLNVAEAPAARVTVPPVVPNCTPSLDVSVTLTVNVLVAPLMFVITTEDERRAARSAREVAERRADRIERRDSGNGGLDVDQPRSDDLGVVGDGAGLRMAEQALLGGVDDGGADLCGRPARVGATHDGGGAGEMRRGHRRAAEEAPAALGRRADRSGAAGTS